MQKKTYFKNKEGLKLCGVLSDPTNDKSKPIVVVCHGDFSSKDSKAYVEIEKALNEKNISTFRFDFSGFGESEGNVENLTVSQGVRDIESAIEFLKASGYSKIGLLGASFGGVASIMVASKSSDLFVLVLKSPVIDYPQNELRFRGEVRMENWQKLGYIEHTSRDGRVSRRNYSFVEDFKNNNTFEVGEKIKAPTIILVGDQDPHVTIKEAQKFSSLLENYKLEIFSGADHHFSKPQDFQKMIQNVVDFVASYK